MNCEAVYHHKQRRIFQQAWRLSGNYLYSLAVKVEVRAILPLKVRLLMICEELVSVLLNQCQKTSLRDAVGQLLIQMKKMLQRKM